MAINDGIIAAYLAAKEAEKTAKKEAEKLAAQIIAAAGDDAAIMTEGYSVIIDTRRRVGLDTERFYADFPDAKDAYPKVTEYKVIIAKQTAAAQRSA